MTLKNYFYRATAFLTALLLSLSLIATSNIQAEAAFETGSLSEPKLIELTDEEQQAIQEASLKYASLTLAGDSTSNPHFEYNYTKDYYYLQLNAVEKQFYQKIYKTAVNYLYSDVNLEGIEKYNNIAMSEAIEYDISIPTEKVWAIWFLFKYSNPQFFFVSTSAFTGSKNSQYKNFYFSIGEKFLKASDRKSMFNKIETTTNNWLKEIDQCSGPLEKETKIYTLLCENIVYGYGKDAKGNVIPDETPEYSSYIYPEYHQNISGAMAEGVCVCAGYVSAFNYLCHLVGIDSIGVIGYGHAWNRVKLYGNWYEIDVTWMDQTWGIYMPYCNISTATMLALKPGAHIPEEDTYDYFDLPDCIYDEVIIVEIAGDINGDWSFDIDDVIDLARSILTTTDPADNPYLPEGDRDKNGVIDIDDVILLARELIM